MSRRASQLSGAYGVKWRRVQRLDSDAILLPPKLFVLRRPLLHRRALTSMASGSGKPFVLLITCQTRSHPQCLDPRLQTQRNAARTTSTLSKRPARPSSPNVRSPNSPPRTHILTSPSLSLILFRKAQRSPDRRIAELPLDRARARTLAHLSPRREPHTQSFVQSRRL